mmetsp:Transcript_4189/g.8712  ORF Transcript_4189/g.8712 Transcript_4189/m.8712 type:complete len:285 (-) Transcript_4189:643-1497(-)
MLGPEVAPEGESKLFVLVATPPVTSPSCPPSAALAFRASTKAVMARITSSGWISRCSTLNASGAESPSSPSPSPPVFPLTNEPVPSTEPASVLSSPSSSSFLAGKKKAMSEVTSASLSTPRALSVDSACTSSASAGGNDSSASLTRLSTRKPASDASSSSTAFIFAPDTIFAAGSSASALSSSLTTTVVGAATVAAAGCFSASRLGARHCQPSCWVVMIESAWSTLSIVFMTSSSCMAQSWSKRLLSLSSKCLNLACRSLYCFVMRRYSSVSSSFFFRSRVSVS